MTFEPNTTVREFAFAIPGATRAFEKAGIDYCCGGQQSLSDACAKAGITIEEMSKSLTAEMPAPATTIPNFLAMTLGELIDHTDTLRSGHRDSTAVSSISLASAASRVSFPSK